MVARRDVPEGWVPGSWLGRSICRTCGKRWLDHDRNSPRLDRSAHSFGDWLGQIGILDIDDAPPDVTETTANTAEGAGWFTLMRLQSWEQQGEYEASLPPPSEQKRIREAAGWTQFRVGEYGSVPPGLRRLASRGTLVTGLPQGLTLPVKGRARHARHSVSRVPTQCIADSRWRESENTLSESCLTCVTGVEIAEHRFARPVAALPVRCIVVSRVICYSEPIGTVVVHDPDVRTAVLTAGEGDLCSVG